MAPIRMPLVVLLAALVSHDGLAVAATTDGAGASAMCAGIERRFPRSGSVVCCPAVCGTCGGAQCSKAPVPNAQATCCPGPIVRAGRQCEANDSGPCLIKKAGDPSCATGTLLNDKKHCFPTTCGEKAGVEPGCALQPGGRKMCCLPSRRKTDSPRDCAKVDPPCVILASFMPEGTGGAARQQMSKGGGGAARAAPAASAASAAASASATSTGPPDDSSSGSWLVAMCLGLLVLLCVCMAVLVMLTR
ncbi:hypothetical protein T492DRAFT_847728 [Pavlovales sp. CCMP2436]|nr:hypothetical protein T492DRAFT_847728 [Pavlovales sp. CCMP2436]|mmetsp:Transcript_3193/g.7886  ORF Transcript_3193/g.7886 Transcript_3193/m.7886 type:complete len:247 (-) Transcript_3193:203-943(-)